MTLGIELIETYAALAVWPLGLYVTKAQRAGLQECHISLMGGF